MSETAPPILFEILTPDGARRSALCNFEEAAAWAFAEREAAGRDFRLSRKGVALERPSAEEAR